MNSLGVVPLGALINGLYQYAISIVGLCVFIMFLMAGLAYMIPAMRERFPPLKIIQDAVIGLVILFSAYLILNSINPDLVQFPVASSTTGGTVGSAPTPTPFQGGGGSFGGAGASSDF